MNAKQRRKERRKPTVRFDLEANSGAVELSMGGVAWTIQMTEQAQLDFMRQFVEKISKRGNYGKFRNQDSTLDCR